MKKGLLYVMFGKEYDRMAAYSIAYSRRFTNLPICILTNLKEEERDEKWNEIDIEFKYIPLPVEKNRDVKTRMIWYSPFDLTMYIDCDSVIRRIGVEKVFDTLGNKDMLVQKYKTFKKGQKVLYRYKKMMKQVGVGLPMNRYLGGFMVFRKNPRVYDFFNLWNKYYKKGTGADMPAFCCAIKNSKLFIKVIFNENKIFAVHKRGGFVIQHNFKGELNEDFGIPKWEPWRDFDINHSRNMTWVDF